MARAQPSGRVAAGGLESKLEGKIVELFGMDVRGLAFFRMGFAALIIIDILNRTRELRAYYTDWGALPRDVAVNYFSSDWVWSLYLAGGNWAFVAAMFAVTIGLAVALFLGYRTRVVAVLLWVMMLSLHNRNPLVLQSGDTLLRMMLFWALFTPLGAALAINSKTPAVSKPPVSKRVFSIGTLAMTVQILLMYVMTALLKTGNEWRGEGSAVYYTLQLDVFTTQFGAWLAQFPELLRLLTFGTLAVELLVPVLFLLPIFNVFTRTIGILLLVGFHLGLAASLHIGLFSWIAIAALLSFLPTPVWDFLGNQMNRTRLPQAWNSVLATLREKLNVERGNGGESEQSKLFAQPVKFISSGLASILLIYVCLWNLDTLPNIKIDLPSDPAMAFRLNQTWSMFSPKPATNDGWMVIAAQLRGGDEFDLRTGEALTYERPENLATTMAGQRERKYLRNLLQSKNEDYRLYYGKNLCRSWNASHTGDEILETFQIHFMKETSLINYEMSEPEQITIWRHRCFK